MLVFLLLLLARGPETGEGVNSILTVEATIFRCLNSSVRQVVNKLRITTYVFRKRHKNMVKMCTVFF